MKVKELAEKFGMTVHAGHQGTDKDIQCGHCGDLLSEVMGNAGTGSVWLTVQTHMNIIAVAVLKEMAAIVITGGAKPDAETINKADSEGVPVLTWPGKTFDLVAEIAVSEVL